VANTGSKGTQVEMFRKIFNGGSTQGGGRSGKKGDDRRIRGDQIQGEDGVANEGLIFKDAERELYKYEMPTQERGFSDVLQNHEPGRTFGYVAVTGGEEESTESRFSRLFRFQPIIKKALVQTPKRFNMKLFNEIENLPLHSLIKAKMKYEYVLLKRVTFIVSPLMSLFDEYTDVFATVVDLRMKRSQKRQTLKYSSNGTYKGDVSLDYSIPIASLDKVSFSISIEVPIMNNGEQWAACQVEAVIEESDYPQNPTFKEVLGVSGMPKSGLIKYSHDPTTLDLTIHNNHRAQLQDMYLAGDLLEETEARKEKTVKREYVKSSVGPGVLKHQLPGTIPVNDWDAVRRSGPGRVAIDQQSQDPDEGSVQSMTKQNTPLASIEDQDSLLSFEKEAAINAEMNNGADRLSAEDRVKQFNEEKKKRKVNMFEIKVEDIRD
jgi:hypothetical protein